jgi:hypothetical protein
MKKLRRRSDYVKQEFEDDLKCGILKKWLTHYNQGRPHSSIGPGIPDPPADIPVKPQDHRHRISGHLRVVAFPVLGGLHHEYSLSAVAA